MRSLCSVAGTIGRAVPSRAATFATVVLVSLTCATSASASPGWLASTSISTGGTNASQPSVAVAADGETIAAWSCWTAATNACRRPCEVPRAAAGKRPSPSRRAVRAQVARASSAIGPQGEAIVVWDIYNGAHDVVQAAVRPEVGGAWQAPVDLSDTGHEAYAPQIAIDYSDGEAIAAWESYNGAQRHRPGRGARRKPAAPGRRPSTSPTRAMTPTRCRSPLNGKGEAIAVWELNNGSAILAQAAARPEAGGAWQAPVSLSEGSGLAYRPQVAVNDEGEAVVAWTRRGGGSEKVQVSVRAQAGGGWTAPATLASGPSNIDPFEATVAIDAHGDAVAVWALLDQSYNETISASVRPAGAEGWGVSARLSGVGDYAEEPRVAIGPQGEAIAVLEGLRRHLHRGAGGDAGRARRLVDGALGISSKLRPVSPTSRRSRWIPTATRWPFGASPTEASLRSTPRPTSPPGRGLRSCRSPPREKPGRSLSFSVDPLDAWAALGQTEMELRRRGPRNGHERGARLASAGSYEVEVRGADVLGNVTTQTRTVAIEAPPVEEPSEEPTEQAAEEVPPKHDSPAPESRVQEIATVLPATTTDRVPLRRLRPWAGPRPLMLLTKAPEPLINADSLALKVKCGARPARPLRAAGSRCPGIGGPGGSAASPGRLPATRRRLARARARGPAPCGARLPSPAPPLSGRVASDRVAHRRRGPPQDIEAALPIWTYPGFR